MIIGKSEAIEFLSYVETKVSGNVNKIKMLDQEERAFILTAVKAAKSESYITLSGEMVDVKEPCTDTFDLKQRIINKLSSEAKPKPSGFLAAFFKGLGNAFFGRLSSDRVYKAIKER